MKNLKGLDCNFDSSNALDEHLMDDMSSTSSTESSLPTSSQNSISPVVSEEDTDLQQLKHDYMRKIKDNFKVSENKDEVNIMELINLSPNNQVY